LRVAAAELSLGIPEPQEVARLRIEQELMSFTLAPIGRASKEPRSDATALYGGSF
jgi:hypothetical protein